ncbi:MAG: glycosyltransferase family 39 protein, partial [Deltaproteobacteria bacterium]|nr:glycosyltransferase family 39 protein [Deltaproteobacteria bacterium]
MSKKKRNKKSKPLLKNKSNKAEISSSNSILPFWNTYVAKCFGPLLIGITTAIMAWWSWGKWCDPMVDFGRELYVPWQITIGKTLYTDIAYFNGPLSPYFNSIWFSLFGVHLRSILFINFLILACILFFSYKMLKEIGSRTGATLGCLVIITVFAFAKYHFIGGYNFIAPYSHEMTHGLLLSFMGIWCLSTYQRQNKRYLIFFLGVFLGLVFLTKAEFAVAAVFSTITGFLLLLWFQKEPWKYNVIKLTLFLLGIIMSLLIAFLLLYTRMSASNAMTGLLGSWIGIVKADLREMIFYRQLMGADNLVGNVKTMFVSFGLLVLVYVPAVTFSLMNQLSKKQDAIIGLILLAGTILASIFFINFLVS